MIRILTMRNFVLFGDLDLAIDIDILCSTGATIVLRIIIARSARSIDIQDGRCGRRLRIGCGEVLYQTGVVLVHDSYLLAHIVYFTVEPL